MTTIIQSNPSNSSTNKQSSRTIKPKWKKFTVIQTQNIYINQNRIIFILFLFKKKDINFVYNWVYFDSFSLCVCLPIDKTIRMLFQNANPKSVGKGIHNNNNDEIEMKASSHGEAAQPVTKWQEFGENICLRGDGQINYIDMNSKFVNEKVSRRCRFCAKPSAIQATDCINCNLEICEFCGISCIQCNAPLCLSCVQLFGCCDNSVDMNACCERCKIYNNQ